MKAAILSATLALVVSTLALLTLSQATDVDGRQSQRQGLKAEPPRTTDAASMEAHDVQEVVEATVNETEPDYLAERTGKLIVRTSRPWSDISLLDLNGEPVEPCREEWKFLWDEAMRRLDRGGDWFGGPGRMRSFARCWALLLTDTNGVWRRWYIEPGTYGVCTGFIPIPTPITIVAGQMTEVCIP